MVWGPTETPCISMYILELIWVSFFVFRDAIVYATSSFTDGLETVMKILSDAIFRPKITDEVVRMLINSLIADLII